MLGWLAKKSENARVYMCVKEVLWDLEKADGLRRATLLMLAQWFRLTMTDDGGCPIPCSIGRWIIRAPT
ncbi:hypothetical protein BOSE62_30244 [Bosea sp. 62]|nr:hypothetical protein BOSE46_130288 [Bosea sp. 46]CAD5267838.1 hypothetical protein BOSE21B_111380 [Bosea sp. 21B]CAD5271114.1 hypothetical protein BOSE7B_30015 [Bosea sp. 7B]VVT55557.1 hypothetical protein BOS5A_120015 [Bosea sp. EC-HK365B]VXB88354.1 hypothetical protein BOSE29B_130218 [Bosea sp. 29B]VXC15261.1 hypothetical protein BOSE62_30244 [Bosea sp. 62]VXC26817.1 hypothetical protein BOSE125_180343 [Bosea sp. 125]VXC67272.1 hypothetical protein BOSE127_40015 [Bosea sp. 127]